MVFNEWSQVYTVKPLINDRKWVKNKLPGTEQKDHHTNCIVTK